MHCTTGHDYQAPGRAPISRLWGGSLKLPSAQPSGGTPFGHQLFAGVGPARWKASRGATMPASHSLLPSSSASGDLSVEAVEYLDVSFHLEISLSGNFPRHTII